MSFTLNNVEGARNICIIDGGKYNGEIVKYIDKDKDLTNNKYHKYQDFTHLKLTDGKFKPYVDRTASRQVVSCLGCSGSGKSWYLKDYVLSYMEEFPRRYIYLFGPFQDDKTFKELKSPRFKQIALEGYETDPLTLEDIPEDSLCIFDDIDVINNKDVIKLIEKLQGQILKGGRHKSVSCCITSHVSGTQSSATRELMLESTIITLYLGSGAGYNTILERYFGLQKKQIDKLKKMNSRWVSFVKSYPQMYFSENEIGFMKDL
jgi:hypothetical protein